MARRGQWAADPHRQLLCLSSGAGRGPAGVRWALGAVLVSCRTDQLGMFTNKELEQLGPVLDGFSLMTYDYPSPQQ